jgi:hypothetical protein
LNWICFMRPRVCNGNVNVALKKEAHTCKACLVRRMINISLTRSVWVSVWYCCLYSNAWTPYGSWEHNKAFKVNCCHRRSEKHLCLICSFVLCSSIKIKESENATRTVIYFLLFFDCDSVCPSAQPHVRHSPDIYRGETEFGFLRNDVIWGERAHATTCSLGIQLFFSKW